LTTLSFAAVDFLFGDVVVLFIFYVVGAFLVLDWLTPLICSLFLHSASSFSYPTFNGTITDDSTIGGLLRDCGKVGGPFSAIKDGTPSLELAICLMSRCLIGSSM
jgi:hypothetical protein